MLQVAVSSICSIHISLKCDSTVTKASNPHHKAIKLLLCIVCVSLQAPPIVRACAPVRPWSAPRSGQRAPVEMGHQVCAGEHRLQGASVQELESPKEVLLSWVWSTPSLLQLKLK